MGDVNVITSRADDTKGITDYGEKEYWKRHSTTDRPEAPHTTTGPSD